MNRWLKVLQRTILFLAASIPPCTSNAQATLNIDCGWIETFDTTKNSIEPTRGSTFYTITFRSENRGTAKRQGLGAEFSIIASDSEISGETSYIIGEVPIRQSFILNRYTGKIESKFTTAGGSLIHYGHCKTVQRRQF